MFFNKVAGLSLQLYLERYLALLFSFEFCAVFKNTFPTEQIRGMALTEAGWNIFLRSCLLPSSFLKCKLWNNTVVESVARNTVQDS